MVSRGYLEGWADPRGRVDVIDIEHGRGFCTSIGNATVVSYAYDAEVLSNDLEERYASIENAGTPVIVKLRNGADSLTAAEEAAMIDFLDMHLDRGRYADQTKVRAPAVLLKTGGVVEHAELTLGDRMILSQSLPEVLRLKTLGLEQWQWQVVEEHGLVTGDGAVLLWAESKGAKLCTVTFPLSPSRLLVIGQKLPDSLNPNGRLTTKSKRWIVGAPGTLNLNWASDGGGTANRSRS